MLWTFSGFPLRTICPHLTEDLRGNFMLKMRFPVKVDEGVPYYKSISGSIAWVGKACFFGFRGIVCLIQRGTKTGEESREVRIESSEAGKGQFVQNLVFFGGFVQGGEGGPQRRGGEAELIGQKKGLFYAILGLFLQTKGGLRNKSRVSG